MLGNEDIGLPQSLLRLAKHRLTIGSASRAAQNADVDSLNVSAAAAILMERFLDRPAERIKLKWDHKEKEIQLKLPEGLDAQVGDELRPKYIGAQFRADSPEVVETK